MHFLQERWFLPGPFIKLLFSQWIEFTRWSHELASKAELSKGFSDYPSYVSLSYCFDHCSFTVGFISGTTFYFLQKSYDAFIILHVSRRVCIQLYFLALRKSYCHLPIQDTGCLYIYSHLVYVLEYSGGIYLDRFFLAQVIPEYVLSHCPVHWHYLNVTLYGRYAKSVPSDTIATSYCGCLNLN